MGSSAIFNGAYVKLLKDQLKLKDSARILTGTDDPSSVAKEGETGSIYLRQATNAVIPEAITALGTGIDSNTFDFVESIAIYNNELYAGGYFTTANGAPANYFAKWNGTSWVSVGTVNNRVQALKVYNNELYLGGNFTNINGVTGASYLAKWNGTTFSTVGGGSNFFTTVCAFEVYNSELYIGGYFSSGGLISGAERLVKWNGSSFSLVGPAYSLNYQVRALAVYGSDLYIGGYFNTSGGFVSAYLVKWNGSTFSAPAGNANAFNGQVQALATYSGKLYVGGAFTGNVGARLVSFDGTAYATLSGTNLDNDVNALISHSGSLYIGGNFSNAFGVTGASDLVRYDGTSFYTVGAANAFNSTYGIFSFASSGSTLYVGGYFNNVNGAPNTGKIVSYTPSYTVNIPARIYTKTDTGTTTNWKELVDTFNNQTIGGDKTFTGSMTFAGLMNSLTANQDRGLKLIEGGTWTVSGTAPSFQISFDANAYIQVPGLLNARNTITTAQSPISISSGQAAYVNINRTGTASSNLTVSVANIDSIDATNGNLVIIARGTSDGVFVGTSTDKLAPGQSSTLESIGTILANVTTAALKVTQTGTGDAILVEDQASDTTPFVVKADGNVGIGTTSPSYPLQIGNSGSGGFAFDTSLQAIFSLFGAGGNLTLRAQSPTLTNGGEVFLGGSSRGDSYVNSVTLKTNNLDRVFVNSSGNVGIGTASPSELFHVNGNGRFDGTGAVKVSSGLTSERPGTPINGMIRYNTETAAFEGYASNAWSEVGGSTTRDRVTQASHGFVVGDVLYLNGSTYTKASASAAATSEVVGVVSRIIDANTFDVTLNGELTGLVASSYTENALPATGQAVFLSTTAGKLTITEPSTVGQVSLPIGVASGSGTLYVFPKRGITVGGVNARTQITLSNNTTGNIQSVSAYDACRLEGWVYIDGTTDYRFYLQAQFAKGGDGAYYVSYQTAGDTPPSGFSLSVTSAGLVQATMPSIAGYVNAYINYAINAPAVGASFPLSVDSTLVNFSTIQAKDATGLVFKENDSTTTGTVSDTGLWTFGNPGTVATIAGTKDHVIYGSNKNADSNGNLSILTKDAMAIDFGAQLTLGGQYNSSTNAAYAFAGIAGRKENATSNNVAGYMSFLTTSSSGALSEKGRLTSSGTWQLGPASISSYSTFVARITNGFNNYDANPTEGYPVLRLVRGGKTGVTWSSTADFGISRYEDVSTNARTELSIKLTHGSVEDPDVKVGSIKSSGSWTIGYDGFTGTHQVRGLFRGYTNFASSVTSVYNFNDGALVVGNGNATTSSKAFIGMESLGGGGGCGFVFTRGGSFDTSVQVWTSRASSVSGGGQLTDAGPYVATQGTSWTTSSDIRLKNVISECTYGLDTVGKMTPIVYSLKSDDEESAKPRLGFSAQEMESLVPEVISKDPQGYLGIQYSEMIPVLVKAIQELKTELDEAKAEIQALKITN